MAKKKASGKTNLRDDEFSVWVTFPKEFRPVLRETAGGLDIPMSEFCRRAVTEAVRRVQAGERPFPEE